MTGLSVFKTLACLAKNRVPGQLVIQITSQCNANWPQCGMRKTADIRRTRLKTDDIRQILDAAGEKGVQAVSFTGGEPLLYLDRITDLITHAGRAGIRAACTVYAHRPKDLLKKIDPYGVAELKNMDSGTIPIRQSQRPDTSEFLDIVGHQIGINNIQFYRLSRSESSPSAERISDSDGKSSLQEPAKFKIS
ncbi:MAG: radical SAM protein [Desulfotignum sp.]|nr:radical SAM protein [Desulfotignum sp.]